MCTVCMYMCNPCVLRMYACIQLYVCMTCMCMYVRTYVCMYLYNMYVRMYVCMYVCTYVCMHMLDGCFCVTGLCVEFSNALYQHTQTSHSSQCSH